MSWEVAANVTYLVSILLATRNSWHTWWTGIVGCLLFGWLFLQAKLYADVTLQVFFIVTSVYGWWHWQRGHEGTPAPISRSSAGELTIWATAAIVGAMGYGALLLKFTDAYAPFVDSLVLTFSMLAQFLLMRRRVETWWCWLIVNTISVPLYLSRDLQLTAAFYAAYWINACVAMRHWYVLLGRERTLQVPQVSGAQ
ncbi:nicotinamide riboside transporter PnuC [Steroidobacter sp.]|uniref:nicotinamide riboside transporter PnuC n=1 Tax=Steroidobacter sp. TaxID=1978227 RepID=UPI001A46B949|nr:nicotinamide riboside transporter PnuC [Steroidobacter sp.]MBL8270417.1 nicotinamide mononucleotide transporter [Steroidobacter sp.]